MMRNGSHMLLAYVAIFILTSLPAASSMNDREGFQTFMRVLDRVARQDTREYFAETYPHVPEAQRKYIGFVPSNLYRLIQGADQTGRLTFPLPQPGHALLLTESVAPGTKIRGPHRTYWTTSSDNLATANAQTIRGLGVVRDNTGQLHWFRTVPFDPLPSSLAEQRSAPAVTSTNHIPPQDVSGTRFDPRHVALSLPNNEAYHAKRKIILGHVSVLPLTGPHQGEKHVYPTELLQQVLSLPGSRVGSETLVEWADSPNWTDKEKKAIEKALKAKQRVLGISRSSSEIGSSSTSSTSSRNWLQKFRKSFSRSKPSTAEGGGRSPASSAGSE